MPPKRQHQHNYRHSGMYLHNQGRSMPSGTKQSQATAVSAPVNISHKNGSASSNWNQFRKMQGMVANEEIGTRGGRLPLMMMRGDGQGFEQEGRGGVRDGRRPSLKALGRANWSTKLTKCIAMDCEMVGTGQNGCISILARVSLVNSNGDCVYDKFVKPSTRVTDYRTFVSGIRPHDLLDGEDYMIVKQEVTNILRNRVLVGHALKHDLEVLCLKHPHKFTRDTITFNKFRREHNNTMSLKNLAKQFLGVNIQDGEHDSVEDARSAMMLYMTYRKEWEQERREGFNKVAAQRRPSVSTQAHALHYFI